jgi:ADP-heptose:LPS heptosyltransferase
MAPWADVLYAMDRVWWQQYADEVRQRFRGDCWAPLRFPGVKREIFNSGKNSGVGAVSLAAHWGVKRIILLGYDCQLTAGRAHWHEDHPNGLGNAGAVKEWPKQFAELAARLKWVEVINSTRDTALKCFRMEPLKDALARTSKPALFIEGMHGLGDNLHQRAVVKELARRHDVWLETPWACLYHDMPEIHLVCKGSKLRTQAKNVERESDRFCKDDVPSNATRLRVHYKPDMVRKHRSVLAAMSAQCGVKPGDFRLPVPSAWAERAKDLLRHLKPDRPIMIYRPLVERAEWGACRNRNPDPQVYAELFHAIRDRYFVISVADLEPAKEWMVGERVQADAEFHAGELDVELLAALVKEAGLVFTSPGFALVLAQAVGTPVVGIFGGYEHSGSFAAGARFTPTLGIDTVRPCQCFSHTHRCDKRIDVDGARRRLMEFIDGTGHPTAGEGALASRFE